MLRHPREPQLRPPPPVVRTVRVLRSEAELAEASARAAVHARRLEERLEARAARDAWMAEHHTGDRLHEGGRVRTVGPVTGLLGPARGDAAALAARIDVEPARIGSGAPQLTEVAAQAPAA